MRTTHFTKSAHDSVHVHHADTIIYPSIHLSIHHSSIRTIPITCQVAKQSHEVDRNSRPAQVVVEHRDELFDGVYNSTPEPRMR